MLGVGLFQVFQDSGSFRQVLARVGGNRGHFGGWADCTQFWICGVNRVLFEWNPFLERKSSRQPQTIGAGSWVEIQLNLDARTGAPSQDRKYEADPTSSARNQNYLVC